MVEMVLNGENILIDELCVPFVDFFNKIGLKTQFSCEEHSDVQTFYIIFDKSVTDEMIIDFQKKCWFTLLDNYPFRKWVCISVKKWHGIRIYKRME